MDQVFVISPLVGSVIGYFTNWLAIKMLFRPLTEKRFLGIKLPLTPGVIPRRRDKLAESIGSTVGSKLLTSDAFRQLLQGTEMQEKVKGFIRCQLQKLESEERSLQEIIDQIMKEQEDKGELKSEAREIISQLVNNLLAEGNIVSLADNVLAKLDKKTVADYFKSDDYQELKTKLLAKVDDQVIEDLLVSGLKLARKKAKASGQTVKELLPQPLIAELKKWLRTQEPKLSAQLKEFIQSEEMKEKLSQKVDSTLGNGPLMGMLGGFKDNLLEKFIAMMIEFLEEEDTKAEIRTQLTKFVDSLLETPLSELAAQVTEENLTQLAQTIVDYIDKDKREKLITGLEEKLADQVEKETLQQGVREVVIQLASDSTALAANASDLIYSWLSVLSQRSICDYFTEVSETRLRRMETGLVNIIEYIMEHQFGDVLANLDFEQMVIEKVNSFDVLEVEGLLLDVIETELNAITWFGAGLGFVMGLITPVISLLTG